MNIKVNTDINDPWPPAHIVYWNFPDGNSGTKNLLQYCCIDTL